MHLLEKMKLTEVICDNQDLTMHTMMSDGVATVRQTVFSVAAGANKRRTLAL